LAASLDETKRYAGLKFPYQSTTAPRVLAFDYYKATEGMTGRACFNAISSAACPFKTTELDTKVEDRAWKTTKPIEIPPNTNLIVVGTQNRDVPEKSGVFHHGVFGIDSVAYLDPSKPSAPGSKYPYESACTSPPHSLAARKRRLARRFSRHVFNV